MFPPVMTRNVPVRAHQKRVIAERQPNDRLNAPPSTDYLTQNSVEFIPFDRRSGTFLPGRSKEDTPDR
jgi:hypothetical protein